MLWLQSYRDRCNHYHRKQVKDLQWAIESNSRLERCLNSIPDARYDKLEELLWQGVSQSRLAFSTPGIEYFPLPHPDWTRKSRGRQENHSAFPRLYDEKILENPSLFQRILVSIQCRNALQIAASRKNCKIWNLQRMNLFINHHKALQRQYFGVLS